MRSSPLYFFLWVLGVFSLPSSRVRPEILNKSPAWPSLSTTASPCPWKPSSTGFRDASIKKESPPCLPSFLTTSTAESCTGPSPPATITVEWRRENSPLLLCREDSVQKSRSGMGFLLAGQANCLICTSLARSTEQQSAFIHAAPSSAMSSPMFRNATMELGVTASTITYSSMCHLRGFLPRDRYTSAFTPKSSLKKKTKTKHKPVHSAHQGTIGSLLCFVSKYRNYLSWLLCPGVQRAAYPRDPALDLLLQEQPSCQLWKTRASVFKLFSQTLAILLFFFFLLEIQQLAAWRIHPTLLCAWGLTLPSLCPLPDGLSFTRKGNNHN